MSARTDAVQVVVAERVWTVDGGSALGWVNAIAVDFTGLAGVLPGLVQERADMIGLYHADPEDVTRRCRIAARKAIERASRRRWSWTVNLVEKAHGGWLYVNGMLLLSGLDAAEMSFANWLDAAYYALWRESSEDGRKKLELELNMPRRGASMLMRKADLEAFAAD